MRNCCRRRRSDIDVKAVGGSSRYEKIAAMIEESEKLKSGTGKQGRASGR